MRTHNRCKMVLLSGSEPVHLSKALQKIKIEVNEAGTKAAAATSKCVLASSDDEVKCQS